MSHRTSRTGATVVEFALVAPVLFLFVLAGIELSRANLVRHTCKIAAVEGARRGIIPGASADECRQFAEAELSTLSIKQANVTVSPNPIKRTDDSVTVTIAAPANLANGFAICQLMHGTIFQSSVTLRRETPDFEYNLSSPSSGGESDDDDDDDEGSSSSWSWTTTTTTTTSSGSTTTKTTSSGSSGAN